MISGSGGVQVVKGYRQMSMRSSPKENDTDKRNQKSRRKPKTVKRSVLENLSSPQPEQYSKNKTNVQRKKFSPKGTSVAAIDGSQLKDHDENLVHQSKTLASKQLVSSKVVVKRRIQY